MIPIEIYNAYSQLLPTLEVLEGRLRESLRKFCDEQHFAILSRVKQLDSLVDKIQTGRYESWEKLDDLVALTIIIPTRAEEQSVLEFLREQFDEVELRAKENTRRSPETFVFDSLRFIGKLKVRLIDDPTQVIFRICFEVQIRTAFDHAWSVTTHSLAYKAKFVDWRILRLAAQLKANVEQLDSIVNSFQNTADVIVRQPWPELDFRQALEQLLRLKLKEGKIPSESEPPNWTRFTEATAKFVRAALPATYLASPDKVFLPLLSEEIDRLGPAKFPRSITLFQFIFGFTIQSGAAKTSFKDFHVLLSDAVIDLYPATEAVTPVFSHVIQ